MSGLTPNGIRYPDGASKAKNLGPELQQMAEDIDEMIGDQFDPNNPLFKETAEEAVDNAVGQQIPEIGLVVAVPKNEPARSGRDMLPVSFQERSKNVYYPSIYPSIYPAAFWVDVGNRRTDMPALRTNGTLAPGQVLSDEVEARIASIAGQHSTTIQRVVMVAALGQSNMVAHGQPVVPLLDAPSSRIWQLPDGGSQLVPAVVPLTTPGGTATGLSPAHVLAREIAREDPECVVVIVPAAKGGSGLVTDPALGYGSWAIDYAGPNPQLYTNAVAMMTTARNQIDAIWGIEPTVIAAWIQGEADGSANVTRAAYEAALDDLIDDWNGRYGGVFLIAGIVPQAATSGTRPQIVAALQDTPRRVQRTAFIPGVDNGGGARGPDDTIHYGREALEVIGRAWFAAMPAATNNITGSHTTPPLVVAATRWLNTVTVDWSAPYCRVTAYEVESNDGTAWTPVTITEPAARRVTFASSVQVQVRVRAIGTDTSNWTAPVATN